MDKIECASLLDSLTYRPGWTFTARPLARWEAAMAGWGDCDVVFTMTCDTVNTDRDCAVKGYPEKKELDWELPVTSASFTDRDALLRAVFDLLMVIELHESREFFRIKSEDYAAPFHPHREDGNALWRRTALTQ